MSTKVKHDMSRRPLPEALGRGDVDKGGAWTVEACPPTRGLPATSVEGRFMNVPMSGDALSTAIRIHEMVHAKVFPKTCVRSLLEVSQLRSHCVLLRRCE